MKIVQFIYENSEIEFELGKNLMVNATEMAKIFGKQVIAFLRNDETKNFISECLKSENSHFLGIKTEEDLFVSKQKSGTWMHRILALKFAAWLNPAFELWVYITIDNLINQHFKDEREALLMKLGAKERKEQKRKELKQLYGHIPQLIEYFELEEEEKEAERRRKKSIAAQVQQLKLELNFGNN